MGHLQDNDEQRQADDRGVVHWQVSLAGNYILLRHYRLVWRGLPADLGWTAAACRGGARKVAYSVNSPPVEGRASYFAAGKPFVSYAHLALSASSPLWRLRRPSTFEQALCLQPLTLADNCALKLGGATGVEKGRIAIAENRMGKRHLPHLRAGVEYHSTLFAIRPIPLREKAFQIVRIAMLR
jgi:hypothetical protein